MAAFEGFLLPSRQMLINAYEELEFPSPTEGNLIVGIIDGHRRNSSILTNCWMTRSYRHTIKADQGRGRNLLDSKVAKEAKGLADWLLSIGHKPDLVVLKDVFGYRNSYSAINALIKDRNYPHIRGEKTEPGDLLKERYLTSWLNIQETISAEKEGRQEGLFGIIQDQHQQFFNTRGVVDEQEERV
jgi:hypothetical protein